MKKTIFILAILLLALPFRVDARNQAPIFPRGGTKLNVEDRINKLSKTAYDLMSKQDKKKVEVLFHQLDHTDRTQNNAQMMKHARLCDELLKIFGEHVSKAKNQGLVSQPSNSGQYGHMPLKETVVNGIDFGVRFHLHNYFKIKGVGTPRNPRRQKSKRVEITTEPVQIEPKK